MPTTWLPPRGWRVSRPAWVAGSAVRRAYARALPRIVAQPVQPPRDLPVEVVTFSSQRDVPEQVASLRALLREWGRPRGATVVSDGSHTLPARRLLERVDRCVRVRDWREVAGPRLPQRVQAYAGASAMGKKLAVEISLEPTGPLLYVDSDVLVLPAGGPLPAELADPGLADGVPRYLLDPEDVYLDRRLLPGPAAAREPLNAGFLVMPGRLDWEPALARLDRLDGEPAFHTEQTLVHLAVQAAGGRPLDPDRWVVATDDMAALRDAHRQPGVVLRHYTSPVRHKFWLAVARTAGAGVFRRGVGRQPALPLAGDSDRPDDRERSSRSR